MFCPFELRADCTSRVGFSASNLDLVFSRVSLLRYGLDYQEFTFIWRPETLEVDVVRLIESSSAHEVARLKQLTACLILFC